MRGLDRETLYFVREKSPTTLDEAIELTAEADLENSTWNSVHGVHLNNETNDKFGSRKRIATIQGVQGSQSRKGKSLSSIQCFLCEEFSHYKRNCPRNQNNDSANK